jgi:hypothetical protein
MKDDWEQWRLRFLRYVAGHTVWDKESDKVRSQLGMKKSDKQIHEKKKKLAGAPTFFY